MKEELQSKLVEILTSIQTAAGKASDFALEQLPDIAQSYITYGRVWSVLDAVVWLLLLPALAFLSGRLLDRRFRKSDDTYPGGLFFGLGGGVATAFALVGVTTIQPLVLVWFAPKVWLLKEIAGLLK